MARQEEVDSARSVQAETRLRSYEFDVTRAIEELQDETGELFKKDELDRLFGKKFIQKKRDEAEQNDLLRVLNAKATAMTADRTKNGIRVETGNGYYSTVSQENSGKIDTILRQGIHPRKFNSLENSLFIPERITVDGKDMEGELSEIIHGILRHEIGEVKYNDWKQFILRQYWIEQRAKKGEMGKGWGKDYGFFINAVGDPRINYLVSKDSETSRKDIVYAELAGISGLVGKLGQLPRHQQFLMLANCREAETFAPSIVDLLKDEADPLAVNDYIKHKKLLEEIARAEDIKEFYRLANKLWVDYAKNIVVADRREIEDYRQLQDLLPMPGGMGSVYDRHNGVLIPLPMEAMEQAGSLPECRVVDRVDTRESRPANRFLDKEKVREISERIQEKRESENGDQRETGRIRSGEQEKGEGKGKKAGKNARKGNHHRRFSGSITDLCNRFANHVHEFTPQQASAIKRRQTRGSLSVRSYINTQGRVRNIYNKMEKYLKYYAVFSVIVDTSGSMGMIAEKRRNKLEFTKDAAYSLCDGLSQKGIPFELITYGSEGNYDLEIVHSIDDLGDFSIAERNRFAAVTATGGQSDVLALESSAERVFKFAEETDGTPFFLMICDGCTGVELKHAIKKVRDNGAIVVGVGIKLDREDKAEFKANFGNNGIFVDNMNRLVFAITDKLKIERNRIMLIS
ncbi:MAG: VWA domain-containing protein [Proteobacteria bacterium]|nr:VWA domain-containing protein [Pseudomonadota bacterium]